MADRYWVGGTAAWDTTAGTKWALTSGGAGGQAVPTSADDVFFSSLSTGTCTIANTGNSAKSINCTGFTGTLTGSADNISVAGSVTLVAGMTYTYTGTLSIIGTGTITSAGKTFGPVSIPNSGFTITLGDALTLGTTRNFSLARSTLDLNGFTLSTGTFSSNTPLSRAIIFGSANIALTSSSAGAVILSMANIFNLTTTGTGGFTRNQSATATVTVGTVGGLYDSHAFNLSVTAGASTLTATAGSFFKNLNFTGSTCQVSSTELIIVESLTLATGGTYTACTPSFVRTQTFNSNGKTLGGCIVNGTGTAITLTLGAALTTVITNTFTLTEGTLDLNGFTLSTGTFSSSNSNTRSIAFGSANIALTSTTAAAVVLSMATATGFTYTGTGGFTRNMAATATMTVGTTGGSVARAPNLAVTSGSSALTITADSWFKNFIFTGATCSITSTNVNIAGDITIPSGVNVGPCSITFRASGTATTNIKSFANITLNGSGAVVTCADGLSANTALTLVDGTLRLKDGATSDFGSIVTTGTTLKYLESSTAGSQATITDPTGTNTVTYLSIKDSNATGGAGFDARDPTNVNAGNNSGWLFAGGGGNFFLIF